MAIMADEWEIGQETLYQAILQAFESDIGSGDTHFHFWLVDTVAEGLKGLLLDEPEKIDGVQVIETKFQEFAQLVLNRQFGGPETVGEFPRISREG